MSIAAGDADAVQRSSWFPWRHSGHRHPALTRADDDRTVGERVADQIASFGGSWPFIFLFLGLIAGWMVLNTVVLQHVAHHKAFDPYPYIALNLMLSGLAGLQAPIIMMSQNRAAARDEALAAHHYGETNAMARLLEQNTELTNQVRDLTLEIEQLTGRIHDMAGHLSCLPHDVLARAGRPPVVAASAAAGPPAAPMGTIPPAAPPATAPPASAPAGDVPPPPAHA